MANEHIARLQKIGLAKETTSGTAVAVSTWIPKSKGLAIPKTTYEYDQGAYGNVDKNREGDHICYISDLAKIKTHYPAWDITQSLDTIFEEIYAANVTSKAAA